MFLFLFFPLSLFLSLYLKSINISLDEDLKRKKKYETFLELLQCARPNLGNKMKRHGPVSKSQQFGGETYIQIKKKKSSLLKYKGRLENEHIALTSVAQLVGYCPRKSRVAC